MFSFTQDTTTVFGNKRIVFGSYTNTLGSTGGVVKTGLSTVEFFDIQPTGVAVIATESVVNGTFPLPNGNVTIVTSADEVGKWMAVGL